MPPEAPDYGAKIGRVAIGEVVLAGGMAQFPDVVSACLFLACDPHRSRIGGAVVAHAPRVVLGVRVGDDG